MLDIRGLDRVAGNDFFCGTVNQSLEQYQKACEETQDFVGFDAESRKDKLLLAKYNFAGGCVSWMFEFSHHAFSH